MFSALTQNALGFVTDGRWSEEPNTVRGWLMLGRLELEQGRLAEARGALEEAIARAELDVRPGLTAYERELLEAPEDQIEFLERALNDSPMGRRRSGLRGGPDVRELDPPRVRELLPDGIHRSSSWFW